MYCARVEQVAAEPREFARLLWMLEYLIYDDLLRGTGWGRRRGWFRDTLDKCKTLSQVGLGCGHGQGFRSSN